jgi:hypothetical protein
MTHARIRCGERSALCEPAIPPRRLIRPDGRGKLHLRLANAPEPLKQTRSKMEVVTEENALKVHNQESFLQ